MNKTSDRQRFLERRRLFEQMRTLEIALADDRRSLKGARNVHERSKILTRIQSIQDALKELDIRFNGFPVNLQPA